MARDTSKPARKAKKQRKQKDPEGRMSLGEHLIELRNRLLWCAVALAVFTAVGWIFYDPIFAVLNQPLVEAREAGLPAVANMTTVGANLDIRLRISAYVGLILSGPMVMYQAWMYIVPGLHKNERRYALGFFGTGIPLFAIGCAFGYFGMMRLVPVLLGFAPGSEDAEFVQNVDFTMYLQMFVRTMLAFGIAFVMPVVLVIVNFMGLVSGKQMLKAWRWVIFLCVAFVAIMVPTPEPMTLLLMSLPVVLLYFGAIFIAMWNDRRREKRAAEQGLDVDTASTIEAPSRIETERYERDRPEST